MDVGIKINIANCHFHRVQIGDHLVVVHYTANSEFYADFGSLVIKANQVKDKRGNYCPSKTFLPIRPME